MYEMYSVLFKFRKSLLFHTLLKERDDKADYTYKACEPCVS